MSRMLLLIVQHNNHNNYSSCDDIDFLSKGYCAARNASNVRHRKLFSLINETSECKLQRARDVPSRIALFAPIALSNFVIGVDETNYSLAGNFEDKSHFPANFPIKIADFHFEFHEGHTKI